MTHRLVGAKPLSEPVLQYCHLEPKEHNSVEFHLKSLSFHWRKMHLNMLSAKCLMMAVLSQSQWVKSLRPSDAILWQKSGSTLCQVMFFASLVLSHDLNHCWLSISWTLRNWTNTEYNNFYSRKLIWKCGLQSGCHFVQGHFDDFHSNVN